MQSANCVPARQLKMGGWMAGWMALPLGAHWDEEIANK